MSKMQSLSTKSIGTALDELIHGIGIDKKLAEYSAVTQWDSIVGNRIAKVTTAKKIVKGTLFVQVKSSVWRNELLLLKNEIIIKVNNALSTSLVKDIKFY